MNTIGTDPELFMYNPANGRMMPVCGLLGGTKGAAIEIGNNTGLQEDNVMAEFNILPQTSAADFADVVRTSRITVMDYIRGKMPDACLYSRGEAHFDFSLLTHPQALTFGCSPDFDAYQHGAPCEPIDPRTLEEENGAWRFAGGHVHIGYDGDEVPDFVAASFADVFLGLWAVPMDHQPKRRTLYGQPGRFRPTSYGIEYRTLSNFWVVANQRAILEVGAQALGLAKYLSETPVAEIRRHFKEMPWGDVQRAITQEDSKLASALRDYAAKQFGLTYINEGV